MTAQAMADILTSISSSRRLPLVVLSSWIRVERVLAAARHDILHAKAPVHVRLSTRAREDVCWVKFPLHVPAEEFASRAIVQWCGIPAPPCTTDRPVATLPRFGYDGGHGLAPLNGL